MSQTNEVRVCHHCGLGDGTLLSGPTKGGYYFHFPNEQCFSLTRVDQTRIVVERVIDMLIGEWVIGNKGPLVRALRREFMEVKP